MTTDRMAPTSTEGKFYDAALDVLAEDGYGALKVRALCRRMGLTTGVFYHSFSSWKEFTDRLLDFWREDGTLRVARLAASQTDDLHRLDDLVAAAMSLPHRAEAAIRVWGGIDADVGRVVAQVDQERLEAVSAAFLAVTGDPHLSERLAKAGIYLLVGFEQSHLPEDPATLEWALRLIEALALDPRVVEPS
ncbi:TetR/AcrR family transcriptional regulator [Nocardioides sp.]|uniref:TetR/AcrR family transcriptional regulator n=1 Tax=Nocardioides sp. TaxID=35761 RepID=UPI00286C5E21|nr:TetR/AcrR family transcriptional regulator [Nocardioides sp.]